MRSVVIKHLLTPFSFCRK